MKKTIAYLPMWLLYYTGDLISRTFVWEYSVRVYIIYQFCMLWSLQLQDWAGFEKPWKYPEENEEE